MYKQMISYYSLVSRNYPESNTTSYNIDKYQLRANSFWYIFQNDILEMYLI